MARSASLLLCGLILVPALASRAPALDGPGDGDPAHLIGTWRGTSLCTDRVAAPACNDETVVYEFSAGPQAGTVRCAAERVVNGSRQSMGDLDFTFDTVEGCWKAEFSSPRVKSVWCLAVTGDQLSGTARLVPGRETIRKVEARKDAASPAPGPAASEITAADREAVDRLVRGDVGSGRSADGQPVAEYAGARRYVVGTGPKAGTLYVAAQYTVETGNTWQLYAAVFDRATHRLLGRGRIGGKGYREATIATLREGVLVVAFKYYAKADAMCCPSVAGESRFEIRDGGLWEFAAEVAGSGAHS